MAVVSGTVSPTGQGATGRFVHSGSVRRDERNHPPAAPVPPSVGIVWPVTNADSSRAWPVTWSGSRMSMTTARADRDPISEQPAGLSYLLYAHLPGGLIARFAPHRTGRYGGGSRTPRLTDSDTPIAVEPQSN